MTGKTESRRRRVLYGLAAMLFLAAMLYRFPPERYGFYPTCPVYAWTGWRCPGCGMTRALAALVRGHVAEAVGSNPLVMFVPVVAAWGLMVYRRGVWPQVSNAAVACMVVAAGVFMVARNL